MLSDDCFRIIKDEDYLYIHSKVIKSKIGLILGFLSRNPFALRRAGFEEKLSLFMLVSVFDIKNVGSSPKQRAFYSLFSVISVRWDVRIKTENFGFSN